MTQSELYPLGLRIAGRKVVVIGGGKVGTRRVHGLLAAGASVTLISPEVTADLADLVAKGSIDWHQRGFESGDLAGAWLVQTATGVAEVDAAVTQEAEAHQIISVNAAEAEKSTAWVPAVARFDGVTVAAFGGGDPRRGMALRDAIQDQLTEGKLPTAAVRKAQEKLAGTVALVGGGPGAEDLITVRGQRLLYAADVVVTDRLGPRALLEHLHPGVEVIDVGKGPSNHPVPQDQINQILVDQAKLGKRVVRLKGGDPYVFGRGGEELDFCVANGVEVEVVPGVSSAIAVPALAGIPLTHRGVSTSFTVITGHIAVSEITGGRDHTVVILMGVASLAESAANLAAGARGKDCPIAIIEDGYGQGQRITRSTLGEVAKVAAEIGVKAPAVIVIGDVVNERNKEEESNE